MKYLKLYEQQEVEFTFEQWLMKYRDIEYIDNHDIFCNSTDRDFEDKITSLKGIEKFPDLIFFNCGRNSLKSLKGIENLTKLEKLVCHENYIESLEELRNLENLTKLICYNNLITSLEPLKNCNKLSSLEIKNNKIKSLKEVEDLPELKYIYCNGNPLEDLPSSNTMKKINYLDNSIFRTYKFQKNFLEEHPERVKDLEKIGFNPEIKREYQELMEFFNIKS